jgi:hypothetical protein
MALHAITPGGAFASSKPDGSACAAECAAGAHEFRFMQYE